MFCDSSVYLLKLDMVLAKTVKCRSHVKKRANKHYLENKVGVVDFANAQGPEVITFLSKIQNHSKNCQIMLVLKFEFNNWMEKLLP